MPSDNSHSRKADIDRHVALFYQVDAGQLDDLICPRCERPAMSVWFTRRGETYFTWLTCKLCGHEIRAQGERPPHYTEERDHSVRVITKDQPLATADQRS